MITGVYKIQNKINNKIYIGSAVDIKKRWRDHKWYLKNNIHHNSHLQSSWNKYGANSFYFSIELECSIENLLIKEKEFMLKYNTFDNNYGYNVNDPEHIFLNRKHSIKTKQLLSSQKIGDKNPMYGKCGIKHHNFNKNMSFETKNKISKNRKGITNGEKHHMSKLKSIDIIKIREMYNVDKLSQRNISKIFGVSYSTINLIILGKTWTHI